MRPIQQDLVILQGATFSSVLQWRTADAMHKIISAVQIGLPTLVSATAHGLTGSGRQPVWITNVKGPNGLNTDGYKCAEPRWATVINADTLAIDMDTGSLTPFQASPAACLTYYPPMDLTGYTGRSQIRASANNPNVLVDLTTENGGIVIDPSAGTIERRIEAAATAALPFTSGVHDLVLIDASGDVVRLAEGSVSVSREVTRPDA